jgi:hypothetical protein
MGPLLPAGFSMKKILPVSLALAFGLLGGGCVVGRRTVDLPVTATAMAPVSKGNVVINSATDVRHFENEPSDPATPSIDGDVNSLSAEQRATFIGRQRNGFGHAMGDITLPEGETVQARVRELIKQGFAHRGYAITTDASADNAVDVKIDQFWAWFTPGFAYIAFEARVYCTFTVRHGGKTESFTVQGYGSNHGQIASNANWQLAYTRAFDDFLAKFDQELEKAGF